MLTVDVANLPLEVGFEPVILAFGWYETDGDKAAYTCQLGFSSLQHEQLVLRESLQTSWSIRLAARLSTVDHGRYVAIDSGH